MSHNVALIYEELKREIKLSVVRVGGCDLDVLAPAITTVRSLPEGAPAPAQMGNFETMSRLFEEAALTPGVTRDSKSHSRTLSTLFFFESE